MGMAILAVALLDLIYINYWVVKSGNSTDINEAVGQARVFKTIPTPNPSVSPSPETKTETKTFETNLSAGRQETVVERETQTIVQTAQKEIFIPMGSGSTNGNAFTDLAGTDVTIDTSKYSAIDSVVFEASIWVEGGNGRAYAQITNVTDKNPLIESQISGSGGSGVVKTSGKIPIPSGQKTYRVMAKTDIVSFAAHVDNARIKITLR